jgi:hypothetical protein
MQEDVTSAEVLARREARRIKIELVESALRIGDVASLRELAAQPFGLVEGNGVKKRSTFQLYFDCNVSKWLKIITGNIQL